MGTRRYASTTLAKATSLQPGWFVIWDGETRSYQAVEVAQYCNSGKGCSGSNAEAAAKAFGIPITTIPTVGINADEFGSSSINSEGNVAGIVEGVPVESYSGSGGSNGSIYYQSGVSGNIYYSIGGATKDVDLMRAQVQKTSLLQRAAQLSSGLQMDFKSAMQLTQLADKIQILESTQNQLTAADHSAVMQNLLSIAGVSQDEVNQVSQTGMQGDMAQVSALMDKVSQNLGMSFTTFRDQILPKLGVSFN